ncbi:MAG: hypothetical protein M8467_19945 [Anaerolineae bacterium]|nr:hypothetical protein [Anaerolineae bacterium]
MNDRAPNDWGSIPDWIQVFFVVLTPLFGVLLQVWLEWDSPWTIFVAAFLALISSLGLVAAFGRLRATPIRTFTQALKARIFSESRQGVANRLLLGLGAGGIVLFVVWRAEKQTQYWWLAIGASVAAWLALGIVSLSITVRRLHADLNDALSSLRTESNATLHKLRAEHSDLHRELQELAKDVTNLEGAVWSYPDGDSDWIPRYDFLIRLDMPTEVIEMSGPDTHQEMASCLGVQHAAIYQHPPVDGKSDAILRFAHQPQVAGQAVLTFYTGIEDARPSASGAVQRSGLIPDGGNRIRFEVYADGRRVFQEIRKTFEWRFHALLLPSLPPTAPYGYQIEFRTNALGEPRWNWAVWGEPRLTELGIVFEELEELRSHVRRLEERGRAQ